MNETDQLDHVDCAVIVVTYNSARYIDDLLNSLPAAAVGLTLRVIVVDNGSVDDTVERARDHADVTCIETGANLGYSGGINVGRQHAGTYGSLAVLNPDLILEPHALKEMYACFSNPAVGMVVPKVFDFSGHRSPSLRREPTLMTAIGDALFGRYFPRRPAILSETVYHEQAYDNRHSVDWAEGAAMLISAACDNAVGSWDERFFLYAEEIDYATRVRGANYRIDYVPQAVVRHRGGGSGESPELVALQVVNRVRYFEKYNRTARAMRAAVILHQALRAASPSHRQALWAVSRRSTWGPLICGLKERSLKATN